MLVYFIRRAHKTQLVPPASLSSDGDGLFYPCPVTSALLEVSSSCIPFNLYPNGIVLCAYTTRIPHYQPAPTINHRDRRPLSPNYNAYFNMPCAFCSTTLARPHTRHGTVYLYLSACPHKCDKLFGDTVRSCDGGAPAQRTRSRTRAHARNDATHGRCCCCCVSCVHKTVSSKGVHSLPRSVRRACSRHK